MSIFHDVIGSATRGVIANEHLLSSEEICSVSSAGGASVSSEGVREGGASAASGDTTEQREVSPASPHSEQDHYEPQTVRCSQTQ